MEFVFALVGVAVAAAAYFIGQRRGGSGAISKIERLETERDGVATELGESQLDLRDANERLDEAHNDITDLKTLLGERDLEMRRLNKSLAEAVDRARRYGGEQEEVRARIQAAVDGEIWTQALAPELQEAHNARRSTIPIIAIGNFKGGVGKTTIAANLGAYFADAAPDTARLSHRVLFIDLDFQGSLSTTLLNVSGGEGGNRVTQLFNRETEAPQAVAASEPLRNRALSGGCRFLDCDYTAAEQEEKLLFQWVGGEGADGDLRLRLTEILHSRAVQDNFDMVILDMPPRNGVYAHNALAAATHMIIATKHDMISAQAIGKFVEYLEGVRLSLCPRMKLVGIAPTMLRQSDSPRGFVEPMMLDAARLWRGEGDVAMLPSIPLRTAISASAGRSFAYLEDMLVRKSFSNLGEAVERRL